MHYHLKTHHKTYKKTVLPSRIFGEVSENPLWYFWGTELGGEGAFKKTFQGQSLTTQLLGTLLNKVKQEGIISHRIKCVGIGFIQNYDRAGV